MEAYGLFQQQDEMVIKKGKVISENGGLVTVDYGTFTHTYSRKKYGQTLFETEDEAAGALEEARRKTRWWD